MVAKSLVAMQKMAGYGADKMTAQGYEVEHAGVGDCYFVGYWKDGEYTSYIVDREDGTCQCKFYAENAPVYGADTTCKHKVYVEREIEAEAARIAEFEREEQEKEMLRAMASAEDADRLEKYRFDADPFH